MIVRLLHSGTPSRQPQSTPSSYEESSKLDHVSIGVRDIARTKRFYDAALAPLGYACLSEGADSLGYGEDAVFYWISAAERPVPEDDTSGLHFCFNAPTRASVDAFHAAARAAGGRDNGGPGLRPDYGPNYYAAFAIDPDGYRLEAYCGGAG
jgi:catechol 2,3-dioxygenase-like lactoylglutathione lyase family enzyme